MYNNHGRDCHTVSPADKCPSFSVPAERGGFFCISAVIAHITLLTCSLFYGLSQSRAECPLGQCRFPVLPLQN